MNIVGVLFTFGAFLAILAFILKRRRDLDEIQKMEEQEKVESEDGYSKLEEFEVSHDEEAWRGDLHTEEDEH